MSLSGPLQSVLIITLGLFSTGCLSKKMAIESTPPGAIVSINDITLGSTPLTTSWHGGGTYRFRLTKKGFAPLVETIKIKHRWFSTPIIDMGADFMTTKDIVDHRTINFQLIPLKKEKLTFSRQKAKEMRAVFEKNIKR